MKYNRKFELTPADIDLIETCLSRELHRRSERYQDSADQQDQADDVDRRAGIDEITELLGKLHQQKVWFGGDPEKDFVPLG